MSGETEEKERRESSREQNRFNELIKFRSAVIASQQFQRDH